MFFALALMLFASALTWLVFAIIADAPFFSAYNRSDAVREYAALLASIEELYIGDYDEDEIAVAAMRAAVGALDDNWSYYMTAEEYRLHIESTTNRFQGIGVNITRDEETGDIRVASVISGAPAQEAGILAGDVIVAVDGTPISGFSTDELRTVLSRPIGDTAEITVMRGDMTVEVLTVVYRVILIDPVSFEMLDGGIGYIRILNFNERSARSFISAVDELAGLGAHALVFDVRGNPGGWVSEVTGMLDHLLPEGEIFIAVDRGGNETITRSGPEYVRLPAVVIIDRFSFSGAEYFAAMLREYDYAQIVGEQTTGKSRMQKIFQLPGGGALNISFSEYLTKNRVSLHDTGGVAPDYELSLTPEEMALKLTGSLDKDADPQLQIALGLLQQQPDSAQLLQVGAFSITI